MTPLDQYKKEVVERFVSELHSFQQGNEMYFRVGQFLSDVIDEAGAKAREEERTQWKDHVEYVRQLSLDDRVWQTATSMVLQTYIPETMAIGRMERERSEQSPELRTPYKGPLDGLLVDEESLTHDR